MSDEATGEFIRIQAALAGRYFLERELGRGGMGIVYLARDVALDRLVALKLLPPQLANDPTLRQRFLTEARTAAKLSHPNIIPIFAVDEVNDLVFFVMAFVDGETLGERIKGRGPLPPSELAKILRDVAWGLAYAHAQGVVHRDVKADNILLERDSGRALIADFGIARVTRDAGATGVGQILGTAEYMSPEQASGEAVDGRSDIYSLGVVAFYALSARLPFEAPTVAAVLAKQITQPAPPIAEACPGVPSTLARAVDRCLAKSPADRFPTAEDLADAVAVALEARRELPVPIRVFIKKSRQLSGALIGTSVLAVLLGADGIVDVAAHSGIPGEARIAALYLTGIVVLLMTLPLGALVARARTLLKSGYSRGDLGAAWKTELEREREERAFEHGRTMSRAERALTGASAAGLTGWIAGAIWSEPLSKVLMSAGATMAVLGGLLSLQRYAARTDLGGRLMGKLWNSRVGKWAFRLANVGLKRSAIGAPAMNRPTELAIGMAVDSLFDALPKAARQQLADLPNVVRGLEADAMKMRQRVDELNEAVAKIEAGRRAVPDAHSLDAHAGRREALDRDLNAARSAAKQRLADAVTALEGIRLNLLRLTAGAGSLDSLTADLAAARDVSDTVGRLLAGHQEVEAHLNALG